MGWENLNPLRHNVRNRQLIRGDLIFTIPFCILFRTQLLKSITMDTLFITSVSVQPDNAEGHVFAVASNDDTLRIYDSRNDSSGG